MTEETPPELLCFSHLRWNFVYQRPQHLMSRYPGKVYYFEEPVHAEGNDGLRVSHPDDKNIIVVTPSLSTALSENRDARLQSLIDQFLQDENINRFIAWYYTPMALKFTRQLQPVLTVYDCMDELSNFKFAPTELRDLEAELFNKADLCLQEATTFTRLRKTCTRISIPFQAASTRSILCRQGSRYRSRQIRHRSLIPASDIMA